MSRIVIELCGCCEKELDNKNKWGLSVDIRQSKGGWGKVEYLFNNNSDEICDSCYESLIKDLNIFINNWESRRGERRPKEIKL